MDRKMVLFLGFALVSFIGAMMTTGLQEKAYNTQMDRLNEAIDEAEKDMGIYDEETSRSTPAITRARNMSLEAQKRAEDMRARLDSLQKMDMEEMGYGELSEEEVDDYRSSFDEEYARR